MFTKKNIFIIHFISCFTLMRGQNCKLILEGRVRDEDNSENLSFAVVKLITSEKVIQTNEKGDFIIEGLCAGNYKLLVQHAGCRDTVFNFYMDRSKKITFKLPHSLNELNEVEVLTEHKDMQPLQAAQTLSPKELDKTKGAGLGDQLKLLNGVTTFNTGATISKPMINGMQGYRILILNNGVRQEGQQWGNEHAPEIDPFIAQKLSVVRGSASVRYGSDAIGGVVLVEPADMPDTAAITGELNALGFKNGRGGVTSFQVQGYHDKMKYFSWRLQGTLKRAGNLKTPDYYLKNTGLEERNFSAAMAYHRKKAGIQVYYSQFQTKVGIFSGAHIGNLTDLNAAFNRAKPADSLAGFSYEFGRPFQDIVHDLLKVETDFHTGPRSRVYFNYAYQYNKRKEYDKHVPRNDKQALADLPELDYRIGTQTAELVWEHNYIKSFRGKYGAQGMFQQNIYYGRFFIPNYENRTIGIFATERFVKPLYEIEGGVRYDYKNLQSYYYSGNQLLSPRLVFSNFSFNTGALYKRDSSFRSGINIASGWRSPAVNELYSNGLHHGVGAIERGDADLKMEKCLNAIATAVINKGRFYSELTAYTYEFKNFIYFEPGSQPELTIRGAYPVFYYRQNDANISGGDLLLRYRFAKQHYLKTKAMWVRGWNRGLKQHLVYMPADRYELMVTLSLKDRKKFRESYLEPAFIFVNRQNRIPQAADFAPPPPAYYLFGFNAGTTIIAGKQPLILTLSISNAANAVYRDYLDRFRYFNDAPGTNYTLRLRMPINFYEKRKQ